MTQQPQWMLNMIQMSWQNFPQILNQKHIGGEDYKQQFIVCRQLTPGIILGRDFLSKNQLGITWGPEGVLQLSDSQDIPIQSEPGEEAAQVEGQ